MADDQKETNSKLTEVNRKLTEISSKLGNVTDATNENTKEQKKRGPRGPYAKDGAKTAERTADAAEKTAEEAKKEGKKSSSKESRERALLGQSQKQYEETVKQREIAKEAKKEMTEIGSSIKGDAKNNKQYQEAEKKFNKEQSKAQKLEGRRNLLSRFKDTKEKGGTGAAVKELGGTAMEGIGKTFKSIGGFLGKFSKIFSLLVIPALVLLVNSPAWDWLKGFAKSVGNFFSESGPLASGLKPILEFLGVEGELGNVMKGIMLLAGGLTAAVIFAPFKVMGGIKNIGAFLGKKMFGLVSTLGKALKPKSVPMPGEKSAAASGAAKGGAARGGSARGGAARGGAARGGAGRGGGITKVAKGLATMGQAAGKSIGSFIGGILKGIAGGLAAFANPLALGGLAAVTLALVVLEDSFVPIGKLVESVGKSIKTTFEGIGVVVKDIGASVGSVITSMGDAIGAVVDKISKLSTAGTEATTKQIKELSAIPAEGMIAAAKGIDAMKKALADFGGGTLSKIGDSLFGSGGPIEKIVELTKKVPELMKAAEAINVLGAAGSDFAAADAELSRRKKIAELSKDIAGGTGYMTDESDIAEKRAELAELRSQSMASGLSGGSPAARARNARSITASGAPGGRAAPPPNIVSAPTTVNNTNPTSNNTSNSPSLKPAGSSGTYAGSMTNAGFM